MCPSQPSILFIIFYHNWYFIYIINIIFILTYILPTAIIITYILLYHLLIQLPNYHIIIVDWFISNVVAMPIIRHCCALLPPVGPTSASPISRTLRLPLALARRNLHFNPPSHFHYIYLLSFLYHYHYYYLFITLFMLYLIIFLIIPINKFRTVAKKVF